MSTLKTVLAGAVIAGCAASAALAEDLSGSRTQLGRGTTSRVTFDRGNLSGGQPVFSGERKGPAVNGVPSDLSAIQMQTLADALQHIRDLRKQGLTSDAQIVNGDPTRVPPIAGLTAAERAVLTLMEVPGTFSYARAATAIIQPSKHQAIFYAFDIDRILNNESELIPNGRLGVPDVRIPVRPVRYERIVSSAPDQGLTGGWTTGGTATTAPHYRVPIPQFAVRSDGTLARDPNTNPQRLITLQLLGPGNWYNTRPENLPPEYSYNQGDQKFRVAMSTDPSDSSPDPFLSGGHIHCYWIYDFGNPPNCHAFARSGDPTAVGGSQGGYDSANSGYGSYGTTVVVAVDNRGQDN